MNKILRIIRREYKQAGITVAGKVKSCGLQPSYMISFAAVVAALICGATPSRALDPAALPTGGQIVSGSGSIVQSGSNMTVNQDTNRMVANWNTFNIGQNAAVKFQQPNATSVALNRISDQNPSQIMGNLTANGQIFLLNPSGIIFGQTAKVDVGGIVASSLNLSNENFMSGNYLFEKAGNAGAVINQGSIRTANGGYVAFLAPQVSNEGTITANKGSVVMAATGKVTLDFAGDGLLSYSVAQGAVDALAQNSGLIKADGGMVVMTAKAADSLTQAVVNNSGTIEAQTLQNKSGRILLLSDMKHGETVVGGKLDASAPNGGDGGFIETSAAKVNVTDGVQITTLSQQGNSGNWLIDPVDIVVAAAGGNVTGTAIATALNSTNVTLDTTGTGTCTGVACAGLAGVAGDIAINDAISKTGSSATTLTLKANNDININSAISSSSGRLNVVLTADQDNNGSGNVNFGAAGSVVTKNGNFYVGSVSGAYDTVVASGQNFSMSTGSYINAGMGNLDISVKGNIQLPDNSAQATTYALTSTYMDGNNAYYRYYNSGTSVYYYYQPYQYLKLSTTGGNLTSANTNAAVADVVTSVDTTFQANNIGAVGNPIKVSGPTDPYGLASNSTYSTKTFGNTAKTLYISNTVGDSYVNEINVQNYSLVNITIGNQASKTQNIQIMGDAGGDGTTGTGHIILNTDGSGVLALAANNIRTYGVPGISGTYTSTPQGTDPSIFPTSVTINAPTITFANNSVDTGSSVQYYYQGTGTYYKQNYGMSGYSASFSANASTSLTSSQVDGTSDIKSVSTYLASPKIGTSANPLEVGSASTLSLDNTGDSTYVKVVDNTVSSVVLYTRKTAGEHHILWSGGDHIDYTTTGSAVYIPTISGGASNGSNFEATEGMDTSRGARHVNITAMTGYLEYDTNSANVGSASLTSNIYAGNSDRNGGKAIYATNAKDNAAEITAGDITFNISNSTSGSISDIEFAKGGASTNNTLTVNTYQGNVDLRELTANHIKTISTTLNGANAVQNVAIDLAGPDDVNYSDSGTRVTIDAAKVNLSSNNRNWYLQLPSRLLQVDGTSLGTGYYTLYAGNGIKLNGDILTNGGAIDLTGGGATGLALMRNERIDSNADDTGNSTSLGVGGSIRLNGTISGVSAGYSLIVDSSSTDNSGNSITMNSGTGGGSGAYISGLTLTSKGSTNTNDGVIYLYGGTYNLNGNFLSTGNTYLYASTTIDTEQGNLGNGGNITFAGYNLSNGYGGNTHNLNSSTTFAGGNAGNIDLYGTYAHSVISGAAFTITATGGAGGSAGIISLPAISATNNGYNNSQLVAGGIINLYGSITTERSNVGLAGDVRLANSITIDTWQSAAANQTQSGTAGSVTIMGIGVSASAAGKTLTIDTSTNTGAGYFNPPTDNANWTHNGGAVSIKAGNSGGFYVDTLTVNTSKNGDYNVGSNGTISLNGVATTGNQTYTGGATTVTGNVLTNGGAINLSGAASLALSGGPITIDTDMAGGSTAAGSINLGSNKLNGAAALTIDTTADGGGLGADFALPLVGNTTPLSSFSVSAKMITLPAGTTTVATNDGNVTFNSPVNSSASATSGNSRILDISAGTGTVTFGGLVGGVNPITSLNVTAATTAINGGGITTGIAGNGGSQSYSGNLTLGSATTVLEMIDTPANFTLAANKSITNATGSDASLTIKTTANINLNAGSSISSAAGKLNTVLWADTDSNGGTINTNSTSNISTNGGNLTLKSTYDGTDQPLVIAGNANVGAGNIIITGNKLTLTGTLTGSGSLTVQPNTAATTIGIAGGAGTLALTATNFATNFTDGFSGITIGSANAGDVTVGNTALTYNDPLTLKTAGNIVLNSGASLTSSNNALVLNADADTNGGGITINSGSTINTGGGAIVMGGGNCTTANCTAAAKGTGLGETGGIYLSGASGQPVTINSGGGAITLWGEGPNDGGSGILANYTSVDSGTTGSVSLRGDGWYASTTAFSNGHGIRLTDGSTFRGGSGGMTLIGNANVNNTGTWSAAIRLETGTAAYTTNGGLLAVTATADQNWGNNYYIVSEGTGRLGGINQNGDIQLTFSGTSLTPVYLPNINLPIGNLNVTSHRGIDAGNTQTVAGTTTIVGGGPAFDVALTGAGTADWGSTDGAFNTGTLVVSNVRNLSVLDTDALTLGAINTSGTIDIATTTGNLTLNGAVTTTNASVDAIKLNAGKNTAAGTSTGGDIIITDGTVSPGAGGFATLYSGSLAGSTGLTALIGSGTNRFRYNSDEASGTTNYTTALVAGTNAIYREQPTVTTTAGNDTKTYSGVAYSGGNGVTYAGFVNGDTSAILSGALAYGGTSQGAVNVGTYTIIPSGYTKGVGYALAYVNGSLTITGGPAPSNNTAVSTVVASITSPQHHINGTQNQSESNGGSDTGAANMGPGTGSGIFEGNDLGRLVQDKTGYLTDEERLNRL